MLYVSVPDLLVSNLLFVMLYLNRGYFFPLVFNTASSVLSASTVSEDAEIKPRSVATLKRSDHSARSHPLPTLLSKLIEGSPFADEPKTITPTPSHHESKNYPVRICKTLYYVL